MEASAARLKLRHFLDLAHPAGENNRPVSLDRQPVLQRCVMSKLTSIRLLALSGIVTLTATFASLAIAQDKKPDAKPDQPKTEAKPDAAKPDAPAEPRKRNNGTFGEVEKVDAEAKTITLKTGRKNKTETLVVTFNDATKYLIRDKDNRRGKPAKLEDIVTGKRVSVVLSDKDEKKVATSVTVLEPAPKEKK